MADLTTMLVASGPLAVLGAFIMALGVLFLMLSFDVVPAQLRLGDRFSPLQAAQFASILLLAGTAVFLAAPDAKQLDGDSRTGQAPASGQVATTLDSERCPHPQRTIEQLAQSYVGKGPPNSLRAVELVLHLKFATDVERAADGRPPPTTNESP